ncbi:hypothetical protein TKK_0000854 [Trichogramma kaykai]
MSDLINFESPSPSTSGGSSGNSDGCEQQQQRRRCHNQPGHLASPLIPAPTLVLAAAPNDHDDDTTGGSSSDLILRRSIGENNPFDVVSRKANDYERNRDDPFERVMSAAAEGESFGCAGGGSSHLYDDSSNSSSLPKRPKLVAPAASSRRRDSLVPELGDSNHHDDDDDDVEDDDATNSVPVITLSSSSEAAEMSILSISAMNDSLTDSNETNLPLAEQRLRVKCDIDPSLSPRKSPLNKPKRSPLIDSSLRSNIFKEDKKQRSHSSSSMFDDPLPLALRKCNINSNARSCDSLNMPSDSSTRFERTNNNSSVFLGTSDISSIQNSSSVANNSTNKSKDISDVIKRFHKIKARMSTSLIEPEKSTKKEINQIKNKSLNLKSKKSSPCAIKNLIDVDSPPQETAAVDKIIINEARAIARSLEESSSKEANTDDNWLLSKTHFNFDHLPDSDDETVDNLIELSHSSLKESELSKENKSIKVTKSEIKPEIDIKTLETELISPKKDVDQIASAAEHLFEIEKIVQKHKTPDAQRVMHKLHDIQKFLGVECDNNTKTLNLFLHSHNKESTDENKENRSPNSNESCIVFNHRTTRPEVQPTIGLVPKLRKKANSEIVSKKGPLKAVIPLGSMHKVNKQMKVSGVLMTPTKLKSIPRFSGSALNMSNSKKSKPNASSTPNREILRSQRILTEKHFNSQKNISPLNISPVLHKSNQSKLIPVKRHSEWLDKKMSPQKRITTPTKKPRENFVNSKLIRYSPMSPLRN